MSDYDYTLIENNKRQFYNIIGDLVYETCDGCCYGWPSQRDHKCLDVTTEHIIVSHLQEILNRLKETVN
jgi:hypothetical protein